jgi:arylsulfatase A-like enzyme
VPFVARWPARIKAGDVSDRLLCLTDLLATFAAIVGEKLLQHAGEDSLHLSPVLLGRDMAVRESMITQSYTGIVAIRQGPWKLILDTKGSGGVRGTTPDSQPVVTSAREQIGRPASDNSIISSRIPASETISMRSIQRS